MLGSLLRRLTGIIPEPARPVASAPPPPTLVEETRVDPIPEVPPPLAEPEMTLSGLEAAPGPAVNGPVFSSRAVRDATVVTATIEALGKFVGGQDVVGDLAWRLESLTVDQVNFLQLSAEPGLIQRALTRTEMMKGAKVAALRKLLSDLAGGAIPEPVNRANPLVVPKGPILPPLTSLQPRPAPLPASSAAATLPPAPAPLGPAPQPSPVAPSRPVEPAGTLEPVSVALPPLSADNAAPAEPKVKPDPVGAPSLPDDGEEELADPPMPPPVHRLAAPPSGTAPNPVPRLGRQDAEARRARLLASLNDTLSSSEATP